MIRERVKCAGRVGFLFCVGVAVGCGSIDGVDGDGNSDGVKIVLANPGSSGSDAGKSLASKSATSSTITSCTLTGTASGRNSVSKTVSVSSGQSQIETTLDLAVGATWTISVECSDADGEPGVNDNNVPEGIFGQTDVTLTSSGQTISMSGQYLNLITDDSDGAQYIRFKQDKDTQAKLVVGFGSVLTAQQKIDMKCILELDTSGGRTGLGVIDSSRSDGLVSGSLSGPRIEITGGSAEPKCELYNTSGTKTLKLNGSWATNSNNDNKTEARCTFGVRQMRQIVDSNRKGQFAAVCSLTGASPWDSIPDSGYASYNISAGGDGDRATLVANGGSCTASNNGAECETGFCATSGSCLSLSADSLTTVSDYAGPAAGCNPPGCSSGSTNGVGTAASFNLPTSVCITPDGNTLFVTENDNRSIRQISVTDANVTTLAGGTQGTADGTGANAQFDALSSCAVDTTGTYLYAADGGNLNNAIRRVVIATGVVTTFAGSSATGTTNGTGTAARFNDPTDVIIDCDGTNLYVSDAGNHSIRKIVVGSQEVTTLAGTAGVSGLVNGTGTDARFDNPSRLALDSTCTYLYVSEIVNTAIRRINIATQVVTTFKSLSVAAGDLAMDPTDTYLMIDFGSYLDTITISSGTQTTLVGQSGESGDANGTGSTVRFNGAVGLVFNPLGSVLYLADTNNHKIRQLQ